MKSFHELLRKVTTSPYHNQMLRFTAPLNDHFGINHFWYYKITNSGNYSYLGTHSAWNEYCFDEALVAYFPCLRHPSMMESGVKLMKICQDDAYRKILETAWKKFQINFNLNIQQVTSEGIEAFGFGSKFDDPHADERLINRLPLLQQFFKIFCLKHKKLFNLIEEHQINLFSLIGLKFYERPKIVSIPFDREPFLQKLGFDSLLLLTPREKEVLKFISNGFPAPYIAQQLKLCRRTVENYIATIKDKLSCRSKVELIQKALELSSTGYFDP